MPYEIDKLVTGFEISTSDGENRFMLYLTQAFVPSAEFGLAIDAEFGHLFADL